MCNRYKLVYMEIISRNDKQQMKCFLTGESNTGGHLVLTALQLIRKIKSGEIDVVNMELKENGELQHKFGLLSNNSNFDISSLTEYVYIVAVDKHQFDLVLDHRDTYRLIGKHETIKDLSKNDLVAIIQSGKKIANVELNAYAEESIDERRCKRVIVYKEDIDIETIEEKVNKIKSKNPDIMFDGEINPVIRISQLGSFWKMADGTASLASNYLNDSNYLKACGKIINSKLRYIAFVILSEVDLVAWHSILNKMSDVAYQHDATILSEKSFLKLFPYDKEKFKNCIHNIVFLYGEQFMQEFILHPVETVKKYNVPIDAISNIVIWE